MTLQLLLAYALVSHDSIIIVCEHIYPHHPHSPYRESRGEPQKEYGMFCHLVGRLSSKSHIPAFSPCTVWNRTQRKNTYTLTSMHPHRPACMLLMHADIDHIITRFFAYMGATVAIGQSFFPQSCDSSGQFGVLIWPLRRPFITVKPQLWRSATSCGFIQLSQSSVSTIVVFTCPLKLLES